MGFLTAMSLGRKSMRYKLLIAFSLMSVIPLLIMAYFVTNFIFTRLSDMMFQASLLVLFAVWFSLMGYVLAKRIILPVINLAIETKIIANGEYGSKLRIARDDELGDIANAVNIMTDKIRGYVGELQEYSQKTAELNVRIHRKVVALTNLMKLGDLISTGTRFKEIADFSAEKIAGEFHGGFCALFMKEKSGEYSLLSLFDNSGKNIDADEIRGKLSLLEPHLMKNEYLSVDSRSSSKAWWKELRGESGRMNAVLFPMKVNNKIEGVIVSGNFAEDLELNDEDVEVLRAFEKEMVLGYQSSMAAEMVKGLEIVDTLTGLYTFTYLEERLDDEINRSVYYQRPCSLIILDVDDLKEYRVRHGASGVDKTLKQIGNLLKGAIPPIGKAAKSGQDEFGILLPEKNKREALDMAEDIRRKIEKMEGLAGGGDRITVSVGVGENPIDGINAADIIARARQYAAKAREEGKNKVVGE